MSDVHIDDSKCTRCYECIKYCPTGALRLDGTIWVYDESICSKCECCIECEHEALSIEGLPI